MPVESLIFFPFLFFFLNLKQTRDFPVTVWHGEETLKVGGKKREESIYRRQLQEAFRRSQVP